MSMNHVAVDFELDRLHKLCTAKDAEIAELRSEIKRLKEDASWAATHRSELADLRDAFSKSEAENAALREKVAALQKQLDAANLGWA